MSTKCTFFYLQWILEKNLNKKRDSMNCQALVHIAKWYIHCIITNCYLVWWLYHINLLYHVFIILYSSHHIHCIVFIALYSLHRIHCIVFIASYSLHRIHGTNHIWSMCYVLNTLNTLHDDVDTLHRCLYHIY